VDKFKRLIVSYRYQILLAIEIAIVSVGAFVAYLTVYRFEIFVRAALGLTIHYLFFLEYVVFRRMAHEAFGVKFEFPKDIKYFVIDFFVVVIMIWAAVQVLDLIRYLINIFIH